jgi:hypothetical protein
MSKNDVSLTLECVMAAAEGPERRVFLAFHGEDAHDFRMQRFGRRGRNLALETPLETPWFDSPSLPPPSSVAHGALAKPIGHSGWSVFLGAVSGAIGGAAMLALTEYLLKMKQSTVDLAELLSSLASRAHLDFGSPRQAGFAVAIAMGALLGAPLGYLARRLVRIVPRLLFFMILMPVLWLFTQACVLSRVTPELATALPFGPLVLGALAYGLCVGLIPPVRAQ